MSSSPLVLQGFNVGETWGKYLVVIRTLSLGITYRADSSFCNIQTSDTLMLCDSLSMTMWISYVAVVMFCRYHIIQKPEMTLSGDNSLLNLMFSPVLVMGSRVVKYNCEFLQYCAFAGISATGLMGPGKGEPQSGDRVAVAYYPNCFQNECSE